MRWVATHVRIHGGVFVGIAEGRGRSRKWEGWWGWNAESRLNDTGINTFNSTESGRCQTGRKCSVGLASYVPSRVKDTR